MKSKFGLFLTIFLFITIFLCFALSFFCYNFPQQHRGLIFESAQKTGIEPALVASIIKAESNYNTNAVSKAGAVGLMQLMPSTANWVLQKLDKKIDDPNFFDPQLNIAIGCEYLKMLFNQFTNVENVLCAFNAGPTKANEWLNDENCTKNGIITSPPYKETADYVKKVLFYKKFYNLVW